MQESFFSGTVSPPQIWDILDPVHPAERRAEGTSPAGRTPAAMEKIFPLISSSSTGPLGAWHLPRMWLKILLHATGRLPDGYRHGLGGFDEKTLVNLGIDADAFVRFIEADLPTYVQCEAWVRDNAKNIDAASIDAHNEAMRHYLKGEENAAPQRAFVGLADDSERRGVLLNDLDDWQCLYAQVTEESAPVRA